MRQHSVQDIIYFGSEKAAVLRSWLFLLNLSYFLLHTKTLTCKDWGNHKRLCNRQIKQTFKPGTFVKVLHGATFSTDRIFRFWKGSRFYHRDCFSACLSYILLHVKTLACKDWVNHKRLCNRRIKILSWTFVKSSSWSNMQTGRTSDILVLKRQQFYNRDCFSACLSYILLRVKTLACKD